MGSWPKASLTLLQSLDWIPGPVGYGCTHVVMMFSVSAVSTARVHVHPGQSFS